MFYQRSLSIEQRLEELTALIQGGQFSTPALATELNVSIPTVSRGIAALRERGYEIRATRTANGWCYELVAEPGTMSKTLERRPK